MDIPQTTDFLILGLGVSFVLFAGYLASMVIRVRNLQKDVELIEKLSRDED